MIVSMHICGEIFSTQNVLNKGIILAVNSIGNAGVTLFILISGYFGISFNVRKLFNLLVVTCFYSFLSFTVYTLYFHEHFHLLDKISFAFPTFGRLYWFVAIYIVIFCFAPFLNRLVLVLSREKFELLLFVSGVFFVLGPTFLLIEIQNDFGKGLPNLMLSYLLGQYLKYYGFSEFIKLHYKKICIISVFIVFLLNTMLTLFNGNIILRFSRDNNLFILLISISMFYLFLQNHHCSKTINCIASYVFPVYLVHNLFIRYFSSTLVEYQNNNLFFFVFSFVLLVTFWDLFLLNGLEGLSSPKWKIFYLTVLNVDF